MYAAHPGLYLAVTGYATRNFPTCFYNAEGVDNNVTGSTIRPSGRMWCSSSNHSQDTSSGQGVSRSPNWRAKTRRTSCQSDQRKLKAWQWKGKDFQSDQLQFDICFQTTFSSYLKRRLWKRQLSRTNLYNYQDDTAIFKGSQINPQLVFRGSQVKCQWKTGRDNYEEMVKKV